MLIMLEYKYTEIMEYKEITKSTPVVMVEFFASWCPHCQKMIPVIDKAKDVLDGAVDIYQFDIDLNEETAQTEDVNVIPTFIVYKNGIEVWRQSGEIGLQELLAKIQSYNL